VALVGDPRKLVLRTLPAATVALLVAIGAPPATAKTPSVPSAHMHGSKAVAAKSASGAVKDMIRAGNKIRHKKYKWGGGHRNWNDKGYDCSGAVSFVLHKAGILDYPLDSKGFMKWGGKRRGKWVSIFANKEHVYMVVAGLRFDTSYITDGDKSGPGWSEYMRPSKGFRTRHPDGL
jgi:hypothetical protein